MSDAKSKETQTHHARCPKGSLGAASPCVNANLRGKMVEIPSNLPDFDPLPCYQTGPEIISEATRNSHSSRLYRCFWN